MVFLTFLLLCLLKAPGVGFYFTNSDHGFQLSVGTQVLLGRVPGTDVVIGYGPLVMYTTALGLWLTNGSLIGETIICSIGHALCLFLIYHLLSRYASKRLGLIAAGFGFFLQIRFYKWYVWLIPLAILWVWHRYLNAVPERRGRWIAATGLILGVCSLYRPDFGTTETAAIVVLLGLFEVFEPGRSAGRRVRSLGILIASFSVLPLVWLCYLTLHVGLRAPLEYLETTVMTALAVSRGLAQPPPPIRSVLLVYTLLPATYLFVVCAVLIRIKNGAARRIFLALARFRDDWTCVSAPVSVSHGPGTSSSGAFACNRLFRAASVLDDSWARGRRAERRAQALRTLGRGRLRVAPGDARLEARAVWSS